MLAILSPARQINRAALAGLPVTQPLFTRETGRLAEMMQGYNPWELETILRTNPQLALRAAEDFAAYGSEPGSAAALAYHGLAYRHLDAASFTLDDFAFARDHLRHLSAFYGVLRPTDGIVPYRLELCSRLTVDGGNLYRFWGNLMYRELFGHSRLVVNLCSEEYAKAVRPYLKPGDRFLTCRFLSRGRGGLRCVTTTAKMARGEMARMMIKERLTRPEQLREFCWNRFAFQPELSGGDEYIFTQQEE